MCRFNETDVSVFDNRLKELKRTDKYLTVKKSDVTVQEIEGGPIFSMINAETYNSDEGHIQKASEEGCLAFSYTADGKQHIVPFDQIGQASFLQRIGLNCPMMNASTGNTRFDAMSQESKVNAIQSVLPLWKDKVIVLIRDGMARYAGSEASSFEEMQQADLFDHLTCAMQEEYPYAAFVSASGDNSETEVRFDLQDDTLNANLKKAFGEEVTAQILFATSDVGLRAASVFPIAKIEDMVVPIGPSLELLHKKPNKAADIEGLVPKLSGAFKEDAKAIEELGKTKINFPRGCFNAVAKTLISKTVLTKKVVLDVGDEVEMMYPYGCTGLNVYRALLMAIRAETDSRDLKQWDVLVMYETLARTLSVSYSEYDHAVEL